jgi:hypothetical protein
MTGSAVSIERDGLKVTAKFIIPSKGLAIGDAPSQFMATGALQIDKVRIAMSIESVSRTILG